MYRVIPFVFSFQMRLKAVPDSCFLVIGQRGPGIGFSIMDRIWGNQYLSCSVLPSSLDRQVR